LVDHVFVDCRQFMMQAPDFILAHSIICHLSSIRPDTYHLLRLLSKGWLAIIPAVLLKSTLYVTPYQVPFVPAMKSYGLTIFSYRLFWDELLISEHLKHLQYLQQLNLVCRMNMRDIHPVLTHLTSLKSLRTSMRCQGLQYTNQLPPNIKLLSSTQFGIPQISSDQLPEIRTIDIGRPCSLTCLKGYFPHLKTLLLDDCKKLAEPLPPMPQLQVLQLQYDFSLERLFQNWIPQHLVALSLQITEPLLKEISQCTSLQLLDIQSSERITHIEPLWRLKELIKINLSKCTLLKDVTSLQYLKKLQKVFIYESRHLRMDDVQMLTTAIVSDQPRWSRDRKIRKMTCIDVVINLESGKTIELEWSLRRSMIELKDAIFQREGIPVNEQYLIQNGKQLQDHDYLESPYQLHLVRLSRPTAHPKTNSKTTCMLNVDLM